ncbi:MAG: DUF4956 domain-containing protein [Eubacteriales bacterium]|nr:DUF4956 domain-containing protein [Eubacteriales bacterium]
MSKKEIINYLIANNTALPLAQIVLGLLVALFLAFCEYHIYRATYSGVKYSKEFNTTLMMLCIITTLVIMIIGSNLTLSLGLVGALSIIRFRTAVKDAKDAAYLFWSIGIGLACGSSLYVIGLVGSAVIAAMLLVLHKIRCFDENAYLLIVRGTYEDQGKVETLLKGKVRRCRLRMVNENGEMQECTYEISVNKDARELLEAIRELQTGCSVHLVSYAGELTGE